jgi:hypothetical protein
VSVDGIFKCSGDGEWGQASLTSDRKYKTNIVPIEDSLSYIRRMNPVWYDWTIKGKEGVHDYGFIAQEVEDVLPEMVQYRDNGDLALYYDHFTAFLTKGVQEVDQELGCLKSLLRELQNRIIILEDAN